MIRAALLTLLVAGLAAGPAGCERSGDSAAPLLVFGRTGTGAGEFSYPRAAVTAPGGRFYVVDKAARIQCYSQTGEFLFEWQMPEQSAGRPTGLGVGPDGRVYVADTHYSRVVIFDARGTQLDAFGTFGEGPGQFKLTTDVALDRDGNIYVSEYGGNDRISKFSPELKYLFSFGGKDVGRAGLVRPQSLLFSPDGSLWVTDSCNHRVCRFDSEGHLLSEFGHSGDGLGELRFPYGIDMLSDGTLVVAEFGNNRIQRFDTKGNSLGTWGIPGRRPGQLAYPWAVVVEPQDRLVIIDSGNNRVQIIDALARNTWRRS